MKRLTIEKENATYQLLQALKTNRQKRTKRGEIFVESVAAINAAVQKNLAAVWIAYSGEKKLSFWAQDTIDALKPDALLRLSSPLMNGLSERTDASELIVVFSRPDLSLNSYRPGAPPFIVVLDRPSNAGNLGSILRSCDAFGVDAVITTGHGVDPFDPQVIRASLGAVFHQNLYYEESSTALMRWIDTIRNRYQDVEVIGTDSDGSISLQSKTLRKPVVIIFGNEAKGLSVALKQYVDEIVAIPIQGSVNSLNLASAASIFLYSVR